MTLQILQVPDCPNVALLRQRLEALTGTAADVEVTVRVVEDEQEATTVGMTGSPTVLIDGVDPFAEPGQAPSLSCRLYRDAEGRVSGAPPVSALRQVLLGQATGDEVTAQGGPCCAPAESDVSSSATLHTWRARATPADPAERALHQAVLRAFATTGAAPDPVVLEQIAAPFGIPATDLLTRLHERDVLRLGPDGTIRAAYPFSATPTGHRVHLADGPSVEAMCVIDALGIPAMLNTDATISTPDPTGGQRITVTVTDGRAVWDPPTAVVFVGARAGAGPSADVCCGYLNAFADRITGQAWAADHPEIPGALVDGTEAAHLGRSIFASLLAS
jgi:hypothetical protein